MLRKLADDVESGTYGEVVHLHAVAKLKDGTVEVFGFGPNLTVGQTYMDLDLAKHKLLYRGEGA